MKSGEFFFAKAAYLLPASSYSFSGPNSASIDREDLAFSIGYLIVPGFGLVAGYKNSTFKKEAAGTKDTLSGSIAGIKGIAPMDRNISFYLVRSCRHFLFSRCFMISFLCKRTYSQLGSEPHFLHFRS